MQMDAKENFKALVLHAFIFYYLLLSGSCHEIGTATLTQTHYIRDGETIKSLDGSFMLGFFSPGNSTKRYVGIWFGNLTIQTVVWVANRETPLVDSSGVFKIGSDGNFVVLDGKGSVLWSSRSSLATNNSVGLLMDSGNLVLYKQDPQKMDHDRYQWESFNNPTDTFLAGMRFGMNLKTGENQLLTSWKNVNDPAPGDFSLGFDPSRLLQILIWKSSDKYWRSGQWNGQLLTGVPEMTSFHLYGFNIIHDEDEGRLYCIYSNANRSASTFHLTSMGKLERSYWNELALGWDVVWAQPNSECQLYERCGPNGVCDIKGSSLCSCLPGFRPLQPDEWQSGNWSGGCVRNVPLECKDRKVESKDGFMKLTRSKLPDNSILAMTIEESTDNSNSSRTIEARTDCEKWCNRNCSCVAYAYDNGLGCLTWDQDMKDLRKFPNDGQNLYLRLHKSDLRGENNEKLGWVFVILTLAILALLFYAFLAFRRMKKSQAKPWKTENSQKLHFSDMGTHENSNRYFLDVNELDKSGNNGKGPDLPVFGLDVVRVATDNFSVANKLGEGGFGPVYKGKIPSGQLIAVKRLSKESGQGMMEFENEVILIAKLQHRNLVRLLGCCIQGEEKMLIYEYMPNKSLDAFLFDQTKKHELGWKTRFCIIEGIARGLLYLHRDSRLRIIHRDMKASNILLDEDMNPKISDFGTARVFGGNQLEENTVRLVGTYGYMAPEYAMEGLFSMKSDVFSFGVLLLEIVSGRRNAGFIHPDKPLNLLGYAWELWKENKTPDLMDPSIDIFNSQKEVSRCITVGLLCVQDNANDRPSMDGVVFMLSSEMAIIPIPKKPAFSTGRTPTETASSSELRYSVNNLTITMEYGR